MLKRVRQTKFFGELLLLSIHSDEYSMHDKLMKFFGLILILFFTLNAQAQSFSRTFDSKIGATIEVVNFYGRVTVSASEENGEKVFSTVQSSKSLGEKDLKTSSADGKFTLSVNPKDEQTRVDITLKIPLYARVKVRTRGGEVRVSGEIESAEIETETGTISTDVPIEKVKYSFLWTTSRPRYLSDVPLEDIEEKSGGKFSLNGRIGEKGKSKKAKGKSKEEENSVVENTDEDSEENSEEILTEEEKKDEKKDGKSKKKDQKPKFISLNFTTARGIILLNVNPNEVPSDLRERPLTEAAKAVIRSGDGLLTEAIRRASPKFFGDYAKTLPPRKNEPSLTDKPIDKNYSSSNLKQVTARILDVNNRAVGDLKKEDFSVTEFGNDREILSVKPVTAPFDVLLLLDVSGSVENYVDFIRKAARNFIGTMDRRDQIAIVTFNEEVKTVSNFTTDRNRLSESLDTFDAGGGTAYYDALAYGLVDTLRPLKGERTAIVILSDGDDNRSFLPFDSLLGSIQESGALVYPLYVPSGLIAASAQTDANAAIDPLRTKYMALTTKAESEGAKLAQISGGIYYPIRRLEELQKAYDDIVVQLRTAYTITYRSDTKNEGDGVSPRLRVKTNRAGTFVNLGKVTDVSEKEVSQISENDFTQKAQREQSLEEDSPFDSKNITPFFSAPLPENPFQKVSFVEPKDDKIEEISGNVEKIKYKQFVNDKLPESNLENFDINKSQGAFLFDNGAEKIAVSRWISPKRTRSYPYERVYDTLTHDGKKVAIIPVVKDEGLGGERDFLQWDTISLLSLLDVQVILAYYDSAEKNTKRGDQITAQKFDNNYIKARLGEVFNFKGTAREWNERETKQLKNIFEKAKLAYQKISKETNTYLHEADALDELIKYAETPQKFIEFSRAKSQKAQKREFQTDQPKEALATDTKARVTINNSLFGKYFFTCDETKIEPKTVYLIEAKHSARGKFPSKNDIKDGLIKMMLYTNLSSGKLGANPVNFKVQIRLTATRLKGSTNSDEKPENIAKFFTDNNFTVKDKEFFTTLFQEARENKFTIILEHAETAK